MIGMTRTAPTNDSHDRDMVEEVLRLALSCQAGSPTEDECARLNVLLAEDSQARRIYLLACDDTATLIKSAVEKDPAPSLGNLVKTSTRPTFALAVAASLVVAITGWNMWFSPESPLEGEAINTELANTGLAQHEFDRAEPAGRIVSLANVKWVAGADVLPEWSRFSVGQSIRIEAGVVELMLDNSTEIMLEGPADFRLLSLDKAVLRNGQLVARCGPDAVGFEVESPDVKIVDLGTEFGVSVREGMHTDVVVYDGEVDLSSLTGANPLERRLIAGEALHISHQGGESERITEVRGEQYLTPQFPLDRGVGSSRRIISVKDNLRSSETAKYYRVVGRGFGEDCRAYVDRPYEWNGVNETGLPPALMGGDYIMTFNDDKVRKVEIEINLASPSTLYVLFDDRVPTPKWLMQEFADTGWDVGMDEARIDRKLVSGVGPGESIDHVFSVWRRDVPQPATVALGTIRQRPVEVVPDAILESMYGVVVTKFVQSEHEGVF